jgi:LuxR family maltose regulon positive regulatory protein
MWASACLLRGEREAAREALEQVILSGGPVDNVDTTVLSEADLAILAIDDSLWHEAGVHARRAVEVIDGSHIEGYSTTALALAVAARVAFYEGDRERGTQLLARGMRARIGCTSLLPFMSLRVRLQLAKAHLAVGDRSGARHLVREMDDLLRRRPDVGVLSAEVEEFRDLMAGVPGGGSVPLTPAELRVLPYLQTHLTIAEIGERLFISRNTVSSEIGAIYRKLGVTTRAAAVDRASSLGLLGG